jgi:type I site-specific restriction endonuclease
MPMKGGGTDGVGYVDYVLWGDDGKPLGLIEAKRTRKDPRAGQRQAQLYADCRPSDSKRSHGRAIWRSSSRRWSG